MATQLRPNVECSDAEWQARQDLAACYRIYDHLGWSESIYNHISVKVPGEEDTFLINPFGLLYSEVTASNLVKIDVEGNNVGGSPYMVNKAGFTQHAYFHKHLGERAANRLVVCRSTTQFSDKHLPTILRRDEATQPEAIVLDQRIGGKRDLAAAAEST